MESTMFFDSGMAVDLAQRAVYIAHIPVCGQTKKTPKGVFFVCPVLHTAGWALLSFLHQNNCEVLWLYSFIAAAEAPSLAISARAFSAFSRSALTTFSGAREVKDSLASLASMR